MKKLYAGIAAAALTATGLACTAGAASAIPTTPTPSWPSAVGFTPADTSAETATAVAVDDPEYTLYTVSADTDGNVHVVTTTASGSSSDSLLAVTGANAFTPDAVSVASNGAILISGTDESGAVYAVGDVASRTATAYPYTGEEEDGVALSENGRYGVIEGPQSVQRIDLEADASSATDLDLTAQAPGSYNDLVAAAVGDDGTVYAGVDSYAADDSETFAVRAIPTGGAPVATTALDAEPAALLPLADGRLAVSTQASENDAIQFITDGTAGPAVALDGPADRLAADTAGTVWAYATFAAGSITRVDGNAARTFQANYGETWGLAAAPDGSALYLTGATWIDGTGDEEGQDGPASVFELTAPAAPTELNVSAGLDATGSIDVGWVPDAGALGDDYVVTVTDVLEPSHVTSTVLYADDVAADYTSAVVSGLQQDRRYQVAVRAFNGGFYSTSLDGEYLPPIQSGSVTVSGTARVGSTLTAAATGWPAGVTLSYQWSTMESHGYYGGLEDISGATADRLLLTQDLLGKHVAVTVTAHLDDEHGDSSASSTPVTIAADSPVSDPTPTPTPTPAPVTDPTPTPTHTTPPATDPTPQPVQVTKVKAPAIKAATKKLVLKLPGVTNAPGKVKVYDGKTLIGKAKLKNGELKVKLSKHLHRGKHKITVKYAGSSHVAAFSQKTSLKVK